MLAGDRQLLRDARASCDYDVDQGQRSDVRFYLALAQTLRADRVIDVWVWDRAVCSQLAASGHRVLGVDPQATMLDLARAQPYAWDVTWIQGTAKDLPSGWADLVVMTGHVAQYFLDDEAWRQVLVHAHRSLLSRIRGPQ